jgi:ectoine hydroxylase-related dioxygenase (phytanoyl-CoA dioxygenase family)
MKASSPIPFSSYGILAQDNVRNLIDSSVEEVRIKGYTVIESGYSLSELNIISTMFDRVAYDYQKKYSKQLIKNPDEMQLVRALLTHEFSLFMKLVINSSVLEIISKLINGKFILNQQNGLINPPEGNYSQGHWHRDLPYQHFVSSSPLAVNALFCLDDFTAHNGATFVLPASHKLIALPSESYIRSNAVQIEAAAGSYIILDCMTFHAGGMNRSALVRRAINQVYSIPFIKQQINLSHNLDARQLSAFERELLGFTFAESLSVERYLASRSRM